MAVGDDAWIQCKLGVNHQTKHLCFYVGVFCAVVSVPCSLVVICWERADLLAFVCVVFFVCFVSFQNMSGSTSKLRARLAP